MRKEEVLTGIVNGEPSMNMGFRFYHAIFSINLTDDVKDQISIKKGDSMVVHYMNRKPCYIRKGDKVEILGEIIKKELKNKNESLYIIAKKIYNETLKFSFDY